MPQRIVHQAKKGAIFLLCNFLSSNSIVDIKDLADGEILEKTIQSRFPEFLGDPIKENFVKLDKTSESVTEENKLIKLEESDTENVKIEVDVASRDGENIANLSSSPNSLITTDESPAVESEIVLQRFHYIQKFIDDQYHIKSEEVISYNKCMKPNELELTKVAIFVLCEIVKRLIQTDPQHVCTLYHLDANTQEELQECFSLFISERERITKSEVEKLLSKNAKHDTTMVTPKRSVRHKEQHILTSSTPHPVEEIFTNSPLKSFFESPIFKKEDILFKQKEIDGLTKILDDEEEESVKLRYENEDLKKMLKDKDKEYSELKKLVANQENEIELLQRSCQNESCAAEKKKLKSELNGCLSSNEILHKDLCSAYEKNNQQEKIIEELKKSESSKKTIHSSQLQETMVFEFERQQRTICELTNSLSRLKEDLRNVQKQNLYYKDQLSEKIRAKLKNKEENLSKGDLNKSYEKLWITESISFNKSYKEMCKVENWEEPEILGHMFESENRDLRAELQQALFKNKELLKNLEDLKKQNEPKNVSAVATMTMPELIEISKIPEMEKLRISLNQPGDIQEHCYIPSEHYALNDSDSIVADQSVTTEKSEENEYPEVTHGAELWENYDFECKIENTFGINCVGHDSTENSKTNCNDISTSNSVETDLTKKVTLQFGENKYVSQILDFNIFLKSLQRLTTNGSFKNVLKVFKKLQTSSSNGLDLPKLLKIITECVSVATACHTCSSANLQDKSCLTDEYTYENENKTVELDYLRQQISDIREKHCIELKETTDMIDELVKKNNHVQMLYQDFAEKFSNISTTHDELQLKYNEIKSNYMVKVKKYYDAKDCIKSLNEKRAKLKSENLLFKDRLDQVGKIKDQYEKRIRELHAENKLMKKRITKLEKILDQKEAVEKQEIKTEPIFLLQNVHSESSNYPQNINAVSTELHSSSLQDPDESTLSGALYKRTFQFVNDNEEDFLNHSSLAVIKKEYEDNRVAELIRRNSVLPLHLQSSYPVEANLYTTNECLYIKNNETVKCRIPTEILNEENIYKKRKRDEMESEEPSCSTEVTPTTKPKRKREMPTSITKMFSRIRKPHHFRMKPKNDDFPLPP